MTTLFVSTIGGHLTQLFELAPRLVGVDSASRLWVTHDSAHSRSLLADEEAIFVPYIEERDLIGVLRAGPGARRLLKDRGVTDVVSTGSAIAIAYLGAARSVGAAAYFIESTAFMSGRSITGRIVSRFPGVRTFTQSPEMAARDWRYVGSVLDKFEAIEVRSPTEPRTLVVSVGTSTEFGFPRLIERLAQVIPSSVEVLWQTGCTDTSGLDISATPWLPAEALSAAMADADAVVSHAGGGSAVSAFAVGKRPVLVPRTTLEFRNDHQIQIAAYLRSCGLASSVEVEALSWEDIVESTAWSVVSVDPPPFDVSKAG